MENLQKTKSNDNIFLTPAFDKYSDDDKHKYKIFMTNLLRLARETKKHNDENFNFIINADVFSYSIFNRKWVINQKEFNPNAINGIMDFLIDYTVDDLNNLINNYEFESGKI